MKTYNTQKELEKDIVDDTLSTNDDIKINFDLDMPELLIQAKNIDAWHINAKGIYVEDIKADDITANMIYADNIKSKKINTYFLNARGNINARNIKAENIFYFACCHTRDYLICNSIESQHPKGKHWSLEGKVIINGKEQPQ